MSTGGRHRLTVMDPLHARGWPGHPQDRPPDPAPGPPTLLPPAATKKLVASSAVAASPSIYFHWFRVKTLRGCVVLLVSGHRRYVPACCCWTLRPVAWRVCHIYVPCVWSVRDPFSIDFVWRKSLCVDPTLMSEEIGPVDGWTAAATHPPFNRGGHCLGCRCHRGGDARQGDVVWQQTHACDLWVASGVQLPFVVPSFLFGTLTNKKYLSAGRVMGNGDHQSVAPSIMNAVA